MKKYLISLLTLSFFLFYGNQKPETEPHSIIVAQNYSSLTSHLSPINELPNLLYPKLYLKTKVKVT